MNKCNTNLRYSGIPNNGQNKDDLFCFQNIFCLHLGFLHVVFTALQASIFVFTSPVAYHMRLYAYGHKADSAMPFCVFRHQVKNMSLLRFSFKVIHMEQNDVDRTV